MLQERRVHIASVIVTLLGPVPFTSLHFPPTPSSKQPTVVYYHFALSSSTFDRLRLRLRLRLRPALPYLSVCQTTSINSRQDIPLNQQRPLCRQQRTRWRPTEDALALCFWRAKTLSTSAFSFSTIAWGLFGLLTKPPHVYFNVTLKFHNFCFITFWVEHSKYIKIKLRLQQQATVYGKSITDTVSVTVAQCAHISASIHLSESCGLRYKMQQFPNQLSRGNSVVAYSNP